MPPAVCASAAAYNGIGLRCFRLTHKASVWCVVSPRERRTPISDWAASGGGGALRRVMVPALPHPRPPQATPPATVPSGRIWRANPPPPAGLPLTFGGLTSPGHTGWGALPPSSLPPSGGLSPPLYGRTVLTSGGVVLPSLRRRRDWALTLFCPGRVGPHCPDHLCHSLEHSARRLFGPGSS